MDYVITTKVHVQPNHNGAMKNGFMDFGRWASNVTILKRKANAILKIMGDIFVIFKNIREVNVITPKILVLI